VCLVVQLSNYGAENKHERGEKEAPIMMSVFPLGSHDAIMGA
jgi:hypothetical protein